MPVLTAPPAHRFDGPELPGVRAKPDGVGEALAEEGREYNTVWQFARFLAAVADGDPIPSLRQRFGFSRHGSGRAVKRLVDDVAQFGQRKKREEDIRGLVGIGVGAGPTLTLLVTRERSGRFSQYESPSLLAGLPGKIAVEVVAPPRGQGRVHTRPAYGGCSIGHTAPTSGSIACLVTLNGDPSKAQHILSARHVLAPRNASSGDKVHQPAPVFTGSAPIGALTQFSDFSKGKPKADIALARPVDANACQPQLHGTNTRPGPPRMPKLKEQVTLLGAGSNGYTKGSFDRYLAYIDIALNGFGIVRFFEFGRAVMNTVDGDSGAAVLADTDNRAVGVQCAAKSGYAYFSLMGHVVNHFGGLTLA